jgi:hypothetical protein
MRAATPGIAKQPTITKIAVVMPSMIRLRGSSAAPPMEAVRHQQPYAY